MIDTSLGDKPLPPHRRCSSLPSGRYQLLADRWSSPGFLITVLEQRPRRLDDYVNTKLEQNMVLDLRSDLFRHAQRLSLAFHDAAQDRRADEPDQHQASAVGNIVMAIPPLLQSCLTLVGMFVDRAADRLAAGAALADRRAVHLLLGRRLRHADRAARSSACSSSSGSRCRSSTRRWRCCG